MGGFRFLRRKKMKKSKIFKTFLIATSLTTLFSCVSTGVSKSSSTENGNSEDSFVEVNEPAEKVKREPKPITVQNTSNQKEQNFKNMLKNLELKVISAPNSNKPVYTGQQFSVPYVVQVLNENEAAEGIDITVSWPISRTNDTVSYGTTKLKTDAEGKISFLPQAASVAFDDKVTFYPTPVSSSSNIVQEAYALAVESPYKVKSSLTKWPGGIIFVYDVNEKGKPTTNSFSFLQYLRNSGINAGNAPVSDPSYLNKEPIDVYKECINITSGEIKRAANFLVVGSIKYAKPAEVTETSATVAITADITCIEMKTGSVVYKTSITEESSGKTKSIAEQAARKIVAEKAAESVIFGM